MNADVIENSAQFRKFQTQMHRRLVKKRFAGSEVQISNQGGMLRGRYAGKRNSVFGVDVQQVTQRLMRLETMRSVCIPKHQDVALERAERRGWL